MVRSSYVAELVHDAVQEAEDAVKRAAETGAKAIRAAEQGMGASMSVFIAWATRHDVDVDDALNQRDARMKLRFDETGQEARRAIWEGFRIWKEAGMPPERYRIVQIRFGNDDIADAWRYLNTG